MGKGKWTIYRKPKISLNNNNCKMKIKRFDNTLHGQKHVKKTPSYIVGGGVSLWSHIFLPSNSGLMN